MRYQPIHHHKTIVILQEITPQDRKGSRKQCNYMYWLLGSMEHMPKVSTIWAYGKAGNGNGNGNGKLKWRNSCMIVSNHWTGLTNLQTPSFRTKLNVLIQPITCSWAWSGILPRVSRGQRSCAYLVSCNEKIRRALTTHFEQKPIPSLDWSHLPLWSHHSQSLPVVVAIH